jgi:hypothetical protein
LSITSPPLYDIINNLHKYIQRSGDYNLWIGRWSTQSALTLWVPFTNYSLPLKQQIRKYTFQLLHIYSSYITRLHKLRHAAFKDKYADKCAADSSTSNPNLRDQLTRQEPQHHHHLPPNSTVPSAATFTRKRKRQMAPHQIRNLTTASTTDSQILITSNPNLLYYLTPSGSCDFQAPTHIFESLLSIWTPTAHQFLRQHTLHKLLHNPSGSKSYSLITLHNSTPPLTDGPYYAPIHSNQHWSLLILTLKNNQIQRAQYADPLPALHHSIRLHIYHTIFEVLSMVLAFRYQNPQAPTTLLYSNDSTISDPSVQRFLRCYQFPPLQHLSHINTNPLIQPSLSYLYTLQYVIYTQQYKPLATVTSSTVSALRHNILHRLRSLNSHSSSVSNTIPQLFARQGIG